MAEESGEISGLVNDFNTKVRDMEERHNLLKEKLLVASQSFLKQEEKNGKEMMVMKEEMRDMRMELDRLREMMQHLIRDTSEFARREDLAVFEKYMQIWDPLKMVREDDVKRLIEERLNKKSSKTQTL